MYGKQKAIQVLNDFFRDLIEFKTQTMKNM